MKVWLGWGLVISPSCWGVFPLPLLGGRGRERMYSEWHEGATFLIKQFRRLVLLLLRGVPAIYDVSASVGYKQVCHWWFWRMLLIMDKAWSYSRKQPFFIGEKFSEWLNNGRFHKFEGEDFGNNLPMFYPTNVWYIPLVTMVIETSGFAVLQYYYMPWLWLLHWCHPWNEAVQVCWHDYMITIGTSGGPQSDQFGTQLDRLGTLIDKLEGKVYCYRERYFTI